MDRFRNRTAALAIALTASTLACSDPSDPTGSGGEAGDGSAGQSGAGGGSGGTSGGTSGSGGSAGMPSGIGCVGPGYADPVASPQRVDAVSAQFVDAGGSGVADVPALVCGLDVCTQLFRSDAAGQFSVDGLDVDITRPALKFDAVGIDYAELVVLLPDQADVALGALQVFPLELASAGEPLRAGATLISNEVTLTIDADAEVDISPLVFVTDDEQRFRATHIAPPDAVAAWDERFDLALLLALGPVGTELCPPAELAVPNTPAWPAGSDVEIFLHGVDIGEEWAPYGGWAKVSDARVSDDGARIVTPAGGGIPVLGVIGMRRTQ